MKRRTLTLRAVSVLLALCLAIPLTGCGETKMSQRQVFAMDTIMTLSAYGNKAELGLNAAQSVIQSLDTMLDPDVETSVVYAINHADGANVSVTGQVATMLSTARSVYDKSKGALDITLYPLIRRWGFADGRYYVPLGTEIAEDLSRKCFGQMVLTPFPSSGTYAVSFPSYGEISLASVAKGCASQNAIDAMRQAGVTSGIVSLGGNVQTLGLKPDGSNWNVAIQDPNNTDSYLGVVSVGETAVVTSGTYQRFFTQNGKTYHHILNPDTGLCVSNGLTSVTVLCEDGTMADCLSTAMFVLGQTKALNYWRTNGGFEMIIVDSDNNITCTKGLIEKFTLSNSNYNLKFVE